MRKKILTTHTGSFVRPQKLTDMLLAEAKRQYVNPQAFEEACREAVNEVVRKQCETGIDIINDGEQSKTGFAQYIHGRLTGFEGPPIQKPKSLEARDFPDAPVGIVSVTPCTGPLGWKEFSAVERDIAILKNATAGIHDRDVFMASISPGSFTNNNPNHYYSSRSEYMAAVIDIMQREYEAIAAAGFILQLDSPDLAQRSYNFPDMPMSEWLELVRENVDALNSATRRIPREQIRVHVCWGANEGPHNHDTELRDIVHILLMLRTSAISLVCANGRHQHEWRVWESTKIPPEMQLIVGAIDSTTNIVEHPETVALRLIQFAKVVGRDKIIAGVDCGFGTIVSNKPEVAPSVAWAKLQSLVKGAAIASAELGL